MPSVTLTFSSTVTTTDPQTTPVLILGKSKDLINLKYDRIKAKFGSRVSDQIYTSALSVLQASNDPCPLYLNLVSIAPLPNKCSRHNSSSQAHNITKIVSNASKNNVESIVILCERNHVFASGCAVARAYPCYSKKTSFSVQSSTGEKAAKEKINISVEFIILDDMTPLSEAECQMLVVAAESVRMAARIVDTPCNEMHTDAFLQEVCAVGAEFGITPTIIRDKELEDQGFGGIYGVGKAAVHPPALAVLAHTPQGATRSIAWVGKGIVYDTGGLSIKGKSAMPGMKRDCGGAAAILAAFRLAVSSAFNQNLYAVFCLAENSVGPHATRPDDIHTLYSGRTVEINNTDAEGRLVLADGVCYAQKNLKADIILDMATLTGGQSIATGKYHGAVLSNNEFWETALVHAGLSSGDLTFPIPFCPEMHFHEFASAVADMKNSVADRSNALSSCAGLFILSHLGFDYAGSWMHIDMAAPVHCGERATGYGVALLVALFGRYTEIGLLQNIGVVVGDDEVNSNGKKKMRTQ